MGKNGLNALVRDDDDDDDDVRGKYSATLFAIKKDPIFLEGAEALPTLFSNLGRQASAAPAFLSTLANTHVAADAVGKMQGQIHPALAQTLGTFQKVASGLQNAQQKLEADYMRRPNQELGLFSDTPLGPGATKVFSFKPSGGQSWYRLLQFNCSDDQAARFGFLSLFIGGMQHVINGQTAPTTASPGAAPWIGYQIKESSHLSNLQPWTSDAFDNSVTLDCTVVNMTNIAGGDAFTQAPRMKIGVQTDPCGQNYQAAKNSQRLIYANINKRMGHLLYA